MLAGSVGIVVGFGCLLLATVFLSLEILKRLLNRVVLLQERVPSVVREFDESMWTPAFGVPDESAKTTPAERNSFVILDGEGKTALGLAPDRFANSLAIEWSSDATARDELTVVVE